MKKNLLLFALIISLAIPPILLGQSPSVREPKDFKNGFRVAMEIEKEMELVDDPQKNERLNSIGYRVAQRAAPDMTHYSFRIVKMEEPNAFALPGGFIFLTTGMLELEPNDDELAALLGHEIIHVKNEHSNKMNKRQMIMNLLYQAAIIGVAFGIKDGRSGIDPVTGLPRRSGKAEVLQGSAAFGLIFQELFLRGFNRDLELEADHEGMIAASRAGFSPMGTSGLFEKMRQRIYEAPGYGYWRTHPYLEDRMEAARALAPGFPPSKNPADATDFRTATQQTFLQLVSVYKEEEEKTALRRLALGAHRTGKVAEDLRWWFINESEQKEKSKEPFFRDYGQVTGLYEKNIEEMKGKNSSEFVKKLEENLAKLNAEKQKVLPLYEEVLNKGLYETDMLKRFISNFPSNPRLVEVQYRLAENYRLLKKEADAADLYLKILKSVADSSWKNQSRESLHRLIPNLQDLTACYKISEESGDQQLQKKAHERMVVIAQSFDSLQNGYEFRRSFPGSDYEKPVLEQMTKLAGSTFDQAKLYQAVGEYQKALDHYNKILRYCSDLPVADQVRESIVEFQELKSAKG